MLTRKRITRWALLLGALATLAKPQEAHVPVLTLDDAIAQAVANNTNLKTADLEIARAADDLAATEPDALPICRLLRWAANY